MVLIDPPLLKIVDLEREMEELAEEMKEESRRHRRRLQWSIWVLWIATTFNVLSGLHNLGVF